MIDQPELNALLGELSDKKNNVEKLFTAELLQPGILLVTVSGRILGQCESLEIIRKISDTSVGRELYMILNLSRCSYLSSLVLGALARIAENSIKANKKICAFGANDTIIDLLNLTMFNEFIELRQSLDDAVAYVQRMIDVK
ncbi:MAG TPA: STAS domain-containing protein [Chitinispirillaceae bacterium]|jgi:anti-anti-sigma regulatory factor|nr:STAS domain-containing protein [Chitinispirillaceae bacterium]